MCNEDFVEFCKQEPTDIKENASLLMRWQAGDQTARRRLIEGNMGLVIWKVDSYLACNPQYQYMREDLISEGNLVLIEKIDQLRSAALINGSKVVTAYLGTAIIRRIGEYAEENSLIRMSKRTNRRKRGRGEIVPLCSSFADFDGFTGGVPGESLEIQDLIESCCYTDTERKFVELASQKYDLNSIAEELDLPRSTLYAMRQTILARCLGKSDVLKAA